MVRKKLVLKIVDIHYSIVNSEPRKFTVKMILESSTCCAWKIKYEIKKFNKNYVNEQISYFKGEKKTAGLN